MDEPGNPSGVARSGRHLTLVKPEWYSAIAFDPGTTTGWAWALFDKATLIARDSAGCLFDAWEQGLFRYGQVEVGASPAEETVGASIMVQYVQQSMAAAERRLEGSAVCLHRVVVCEGFRLRQRTMDSSLLSPVRLQAKFEMGLAEREVEHRFFEQLPADKKVVTDERLKTGGFWQAGQPHANDAIRHLLIWMRKARRLEQ